MADAKQKLVIDVVARNTAALGGVAAGLNGVKASALGAGTAMKVLGPLLAVLLTGKLIKDIVMTNSRFEDLRTTLSSVTGSVKEGAEAFDFISEFSTKTQFGIEDLTKAYVKLSAAGLQPTEELLNTFTDTAAITTDQVGSLEAVTDMFARTVSGGFNLEIVNRLADRGVPILDIFEKKLNLTRNEITKFGMSAEGSRKLTEAFSEGIKERFGGSTQKLLENTSTKFSNLGIALKNAADDIGEKLKPAIGDTTVALTAFVEENEEAIISVAKFVGTALSKLLWIFGKIFSAVFKVIGAIAKLGNALTDLLGITEKSNKVEKERIENLRKFHDAYKTSTKAIEVQVHAVKEAVVATEELDEKQKELEISFNHNVTAQELLVSGMNSFNDAAVSALTDVIYKAKTLQEALSSIANVALRALIEGFIQLAIVTPILELAEKWLKNIGWLQKDLNSELRKTLWLETAIAAVRGVAKFFGIGLEHGGPARAGQPYIVGEAGPELFVPNSSGTVVPNSSGSGGAAIGGEVNVNFNINAVDAQSFDELLISRKGLIIGTIQQAFRQQGRRLA